MYWELLVSLNADLEEMFALVLFKDENQYAVVEDCQIEEVRYSEMEIVHVFWGKGKNANPYEAEVIFSGMCQESNDF